MFREFSVFGGHLISFASLSLPEGFEGEFVAVAFAFDLHVCSSAEVMRSD